MLLFVATKSENVAFQYAARESKAARWSAYLHQNGVTAAMVTRMGLQAPEWRVLAKAITCESGRKLNAPNSQETVDAIVRHLGYYEGVK